MQRFIQNYKDKNIWLIGASDGIGKALAIDLDRYGTKLILSSRNKEKLNDLNNQLTQTAKIHSFDVSDFSAFQLSANEVFKNQKIDYIIFLPAFYQPTKLNNLAVDVINQTVDINFKSVLYLIKFYTAYLKTNPQATLAVFGSVAGFVGLPYAQPYSATKAAVINLMQSLKAEYPKADIKLINPGFVKTQLTDKNKFKMPAMISKEKASFFILKGLLTNKFEIHFPKRLTLFLKLLQKLPYGLYFRITKKMR